MVSGVYGGVIKFFFVAVKPARIERARSQDLVLCGFILFLFPERFLCRDKVLSGSLALRGSELYYR